MLTKPTTVLAVNIGLFTHMLKSWGFESIGIDSDLLALHYARSHHPADYILADANELPFKDISFDYVIEFELLEHLIDPDKHMAEVLRVLRNRGYLLVSTPNRHVLSRNICNYKSWRNLRFEEREKAAETRKISADYYGHLFLFNSRELKEFLLRHKLSVQGTYMVRLIRLPTRKIPLPPKIHNWLENVLLMVPPFKNHLSADLLVISIKEESDLNEKFSLDVGAGENPKGDVNTDVRPLKGIDVVCHALHLPFKEETFTHVFLSHVVEHFVYRDVIILLEEVNRILTVNGKIEIWTPNFQALSFLKAWLFGGIENRNPPMLYAPLSGLQDYKENVHLSHWSIKLLKKYVCPQGFKVIYARGEGEYKGTLLPLKLFTKLFPSRGGVIHLIAVKE